MVKLFVVVCLVILAVVVSGVLTPVDTAANTREPGIITGLFSAEHLECAAQAEYYSWGGEAEAHSELLVAFFVISFLLLGILTAMVSKKSHG